MKYTGHLNNDIENEALMPGVLAERFPFSTRLLIKFERHYKIRNFGTSFVKAVNTNGGRDFMAMFFNHWVEAFGGFLNGQGRKPEGM
jgi:hypothetical protein